MASAETAEACCSGAGHKGLSASAYTVVLSLVYKHQQLHTPVIMQQHTIIPVTGCIGARACAANPHLMRTGQLQDTQAWTGFVASLQASHAKSPPRPKARKVLSEQHWTGSVRWNRAWDEAAEKEAARPTDEGAASQDADVSGECL